MYQLIRLLRTDPASVAFTNAINEIFMASRLTIVAQRSGNHDVYNMMPYSFE